jgi:hypothetical protein
MPPDAAIKLARQHLEASASNLETEANKVRYNTFDIRALASAAAILGQSDIAERALALLQTAPDASFWAGAITNVELPKIVPERLRTLGTPEQLEKQHPKYCQQRIVERICSCLATDEHLLLCVEGRIEEARSKAHPGLQLEEVAATLAVLGEFDAALSIARGQLLEAFRRRNVTLVLVIEFYRRGRIGDSEAILAELESAGLGACERIHLALGFAGREPWDGYPYPDW